MNRVTRLHGPRCQARDYSLLLALLLILLLILLLTLLLTLLLVQTCHAVHAIRTRLYQLVRVLCNSSSLLVATENHPTRQRKPPWASISPTLHTIQLHSRNSDIIPHPPRHLAAETHQLAASLHVAARQTVPDQMRRRILVAFVYPGITCRLACRCRKVLCGVWTFRAGWRWRERETLRER